MTGKRRWRLSLIPVLAFLVMLPVLLALGAWQLQRGAEKSDLYREFEQAQAMHARDVTGFALVAFDELPRHERVRLRGRYLNDRQVLLDNMPRDGRPGHHVLTPFQPDRADYLLIVDRGWRPGLAQDAVSGIDVDEAVREIEGMLAPFPRPALRLAGMPPPAGWPKVMQFPEADAFANVLQRPVAESRLLLAEGATDGFARGWQAPGIPPERHYAYAFQWFALAAALIVIFFVMARPRVGDDET
jgi:surfeit locus 1 family protein